MYQENCINEENEFKIKMPTQLIIVYVMLQLTTIALAEL